MWLNEEQVDDTAIKIYQKSLTSSCPNHVVIDNLFKEAKLNEIIKVLQKSHDWQTQKHTYSALYVDNEQWHKANSEQRFVQRDVWRRKTVSSKSDNINSAQEFLSFLRGDEFMSVLSRVFNVRITDINVAEPEINTNFFRIGSSGFVKQHADDSPGREVCMLLYLNKEWNSKAGGELVFIGNGGEPISIPPLYNRCVLFDPSSKGSEHWVEKLNAEYAEKFRYNVTSWYWSE